MNFYWIDSRNIIWTLNTTWGTNYTRHKVRLDKVEDPNYTYQITILGEDGEKIDSYVAWTSLQELGKAIETLKTTYDTRIENLCDDGIKFSRKDGSEVILTWEYDETNGSYYNGPVVETNGPNPEAIIREIAPLFNPKNNARDLSAEEIHSFLGTLDDSRVMHQTIKEVLGTACYSPSAVAQLKLNMREENG